QALVERAQVQDGGRQAELFGREDLRRDQAEHGARAASIGEHVRAEARERLDLVREIRVVALGELLPVLLRNDRRQQLHDLIARQRRRRRIERHHVAVLPDDWRRADAEMEVGRPDRHHRLEEPIDRVLAHAGGSSVSATMCAAFTRSVPSSVSTYRNGSGWRVQSLRRSRPSGRYTRTTPRMRRPSERRSQTSRRLATVYPGSRAASLSASATVITWARLYSTVRAPSAV